MISRYSSASHFLLSSLGLGKTLWGGGELSMFHPQHVEIHSEEESKAALCCLLQELQELHEQLWSGDLLETQTKAIDSMKCEIL